MDFSPQPPIELRPIGFISSCFQHKFITPRQGSLSPSSRARINLDKRWIGPGAFDGLESFSHVWIVAWLHHFNHDRTQVKSKVHPPRLEGAKRGVFATRSPHHPNPIGLTLAKLESVHEYHIEVSGVDLIENTPVLDLKPYLPDADRPTEFTRGWLDQVSNDVWEVRFNSEALKQISDLRDSGVLSVSAEEFQKLLIEVIKEDPRPLSYRDKNREPFAAHLYDVNVVFEFCGDHFLVTGCEKKSEGQKTTTINAKPTGPSQRA